MILRVRMLRRPVLRVIGRVRGRGLLVRIICILSFLGRGIDRLIRLTLLILILLLRLRFLCVCLRRGCRLRLVLSRVIFILFGVTIDLGLRSILVNLAAWCWCIRVLMRLRIFLILLLSIRSMVVWWCL